MQILGAELAKKFQAYVDIVTTPQPHDDADLVIIDVATEEEAFTRTAKARLEFLDAKFVFFKNDSSWVKPRVVDLVIEDGFNNVIIDPIFRNPAKPEFKEEIKCIFINQGGSDPWGVTPRIVYAIRSLQVGYTPLVVMGRATHVITMYQVARSGQYYHDISQDEMYALMYAADVAITAPGQTFAELTAMSVPSIVIGHHERHDRIGMELMAERAAIYLGIGPEMQDAMLVEDIVNALESIHSVEKRKEYVDNAQRVVNINGVDKIVEMIGECYGTK
jgi:spore coat polysaccharide biosynthesis predicted glycosyltransferase SpsG